MELTTKKAYTKNTTLAAPLLGLSEYSKDSNFCVYLGFHAPIDDNETSELNNLFGGHPYAQHWLAAADDIYFSDEWIASHHFKTNNIFTGNQTLNLEDYSQIKIDKYGHIIELIEKEIKYYISWNDNGATSAHSGGSMAVLKGEKVTLPTTSPTRSYSITWDLQSGTAGSTAGTTSVTYGFKGWYTSSSGGTQVTNQTQPTATSTYYAQWNDQNPASITVPSNPTRSGYTFLGWFTAKSGGTQITTGNRSITSNTTFYAHWQNNTVYYFSAGITPITSSNYTSANNATTTIPSTHEFTNNSGSKSLVYVLVPSNKTVTAIDTYARVSINMVIDNTITISNHKVYVTDGKISNGGSLTFTIS